VGRKVEDLEDVRYVMAVLREVRDKEADIDTLIGPIEEMYALLTRYEVCARTRLSNVHACTSCCCMYDDAIGQEAWVLAALSFPAGCCATRLQNHFMRNLDQLPPS
jgi:hypothetical protein